jgi:hypothetical protein
MGPSVQESVPKLSAFMLSLSIPTLIGYQKSLCFQDLFEVQKNVHQKKLWQRTDSIVPVLFPGGLPGQNYARKKSENNFVGAQDYACIMIEWNIAMGSVYPYLSM